jgi:hypothetical protein
MGGAMTSSYSVERFIKELCENNYDIQDTQKVVLNEKLDELLKVFTDNKNAYKEYKKYRKEIDEQEGKREINYDDESIKFEIKSATQKFSACMCFCIQINKIFLLNYPDLYLTTLKIMYFLSNTRFNLS